MIDLLVAGNSNGYRAYHQGVVVLGTPGYYTQPTRRILAEGLHLNVDLKRDFAHEGWRATIDITPRQLHAAMVTQMVMLTTRTAVGVALSQDDLVVFVEMAHGLATEQDGCEAVNHLAACVEQYHADMAAHQLAREMQCASTPQTGFLPASEHYQRTAQKRLEQFRGAMRLQHCDPWRIR